MRSVERILVHSCCASCSSYVLEHLARSYDVTAFFHNPNIEPPEEYALRLGDMEKVCTELGVPLIEGKYDPERWKEAVAPFAHLPERSERCRICYRLRLDETARAARDSGIGIFTSTLSVSPHKVHRWIAAEGRSAGERYGVRFLAEDFKKRGGFQESCRRSGELGLTRQDYCGCIYSLEEAKRRREGRGPRRT
jgi:predicted adenine nucleotide alpha hydrolase (AANH) superfamily ATPase